MYKNVLALLLMLPLGLVAPLTYATQALTLVVDVNYIDLRTGPGRGFPKFYSIARGEEMVLIKQRTSWVKVETEDGNTGWMRATDLENTRTLDGKDVRLP